MLTIPQASSSLVWYPESSWAGALATCGDGPGVNFVIGSIASWAHRKPTVSFRYEGGCLFPYPERTVIGKHALRNSMLPLVTLFASVLPALVGGSIVVETVFDLPGMGLYVFESMMRREYNAILGAVLFGAITTVVGLILSDVLYAALDPRIRVAGRAARG